MGNKLKMKDQGYKVFHIKLKSREQNSSILDVFQKICYKRIRENLQRIEAKSKLTRLVSSKGKKLLI